MGGVIKPAAVATGAALGGPGGAALGSFLGNSLSGGDFGESLMGAVEDGALGALGGASGSAMGSRLKPPLNSSLAFGDSRMQNIASGGDLLMNSISSRPSLMPMDFSTPEMSLLETLQARRR